MGGRCGGARAAGLALLTMLGAVAAGAEPGPPDAPADMLPAIGRLAPADPLPEGAAICTGTLVAPDLVLTAAHCIPGWPDAPRPQALVFRAGGRTVRGAAALPAHPPRDPVTDLAFLRLDRAPGPAPLPLAPPPAAGDLRLLAFSRSAPEVRSDRTCPLIGREGALLAVGCAVVSGQSGAPLLADGALVAVVVAAMGGQALARVAPPLP
ncbi:trypsin-like serine peptidase [Frigidibacter oleivorans]|uniref:trypsin-like serine peptidase n=1 Tax=Frigidibacter oleivorans TaxID=2487129 RepID=UPI000F8E0145|nr:trypsin-like peptidase domain-containing protein [Frigidibacter oleivorans]